MEYYNYSAITYFKQIKMKLQGDRPYVDSYFNNYFNLLGKVTGLGEKKRKAFMLLYLYIILYKYEVKV